MLKYCGNFVSKILSSKRMIIQIKDKKILDVNPRLFEMLE